MQTNYQERVLEDDYPIYEGYWYIMDGTPRTSPYTKTVYNLKKDFGIDEVKSCDIVGRNLNPI